MMEEDKKPLWAKSLLLRVISYSILTSVMIAGFAAWAWRDDLVSRKFDYCIEVALIACVMFLLGYYLFGGVVWLCNALIEQLSPSPKKHEQ